MPPVTLTLVVVNVIVFFIAAGPGVPAAGLVLWPLGQGFMPWQLVTYAFLHASLTHLLFNMLGLYSFGPDLERVWGARRYLAYYTTCVVTAAITQLVFTSITRSETPTAGASGGVFGLLLAFAMLFPQRKVLLLIPPIPMPAPVFAVVYGVIELFLGVTGTQEGVAHFAHLGGMVGGFVLLTMWRRHRRR